MRVAARTVLLGTLGLGILSCLVSLGAYAQTFSPSDQCSLTSTSTSNPCTYGPTTSIYAPDGTTPSPASARSDPGVGTSPGIAAGPIDVWGTCRYVDNISNVSGAANSTALFVPFKSKAEWSAFTGHAPGIAIYLEHCSRPWTTTIPAGPGCNPLAGQSSVPDQSVTVPYARYNASAQNDLTGQAPGGATQQAQVTFKCTDGGGNPWTQTATATFIGLDSDSSANGWQLQGVTYSSAPVTKAICGSADGVATASMPTTNLCSAGTTAGAYLSGGQWYWTCIGNGQWQNNANCSAPPTNGQCGSGNGMTYSSAPSGTQLCNMGTPTALATTNGGWSWSCNGASTNASCSANFSSNAQPSCFSAGAAQIITSNTNFAGISQTSVKVQGNGLTVNVDGDITQSCLWVAGSNDTINVGALSGTSGILQSQVVVVGNSNKISGRGWASGMGQSSIVANGNFTTVDVGTSSISQSSISIVGTNPVVNGYTSQSYVSLVGINPVVNGSSGQSTYVISGDNAHVTGGASQSKYTITSKTAVINVGNNGFSQSSLTLTGDSATVSGNGFSQSDVSITGNYATVTLGSISYVYNGNTYYTGGGQSAISITGDHGTITYSAPSGTYSYGSVSTSDGYTITGSYGVINVAASNTIGDGAVINGSHGSITIGSNSISDHGTINGDYGTIVIGTGETSTGATINGHNGSITMDGATTPVP